MFKILSPIPLVNGKNTVDIEGAASKFRVNGDRPEFYFRLDAVEGFAMIRLTPKKNARQVETVTIAPVTNEMTEHRDVVATFTKQAGDELFKIWPEKPLLPGEYALIQYSAEQGHLQVWDFGVGEPAQKSDLLLFGVGGRVGSLADDLQHHFLIFRAVVVDLLAVVRHEGPWRQREWCCPARTSARCRPTRFPKEPSRSGHWDGNAAGSCGAAAI